MKLVVKNSEDDQLNHHIGQQTVRFTCKDCNVHKMMKIAELEDFVNGCTKCDSKIDLRRT